MPLNSNSDRTRRRLGDCIIFVGGLRGIVDRSRTPGGSIGVGGAPSGLVDEDCAKAGLEKMASSLK
jgi:uncharacterized protein GlcG (DUF336 family)